MMKDLKLDHNEELRPELELTNFELRSEVQRRTWGGFGVMFVSGSLLAVIEAGRLYTNVFFRIKVAALLLAGLNVLIFNLTVYRTVESWDRAPLTPLQARVAGAFSLALWFCIMAAGRALGYSLDYNT